MTTTTDGAVYRLRFKHSGKFSNKTWSTLGKLTGYIRTHVAMRAEDWEVVVFRPVPDVPADDAAKIAAAFADAKAKFLGLSARKAARLASW